MVLGTATYARGSKGVYGEASAAALSLVKIGDTYSDFYEIQELQRVLHTGSEEVQPQMPGAN
jgi:hypothetical protein